MTSQKQRGNPQLWQPLPQPVLCCFSLPVITCTSPNVQNGDVAGGQSAVYRPGASVTFQCHPGYVLWGSREATCQPDGRWAPAVPACEPGERGTWGLRGRMPRAILVLEGPGGPAFCLTRAASGATVFCRVTCAPPLGKMTKRPFSAPALLVLPCPPPPVIAHATHSAELGANFTSGMSVSYSCQPGFSLLGDPSVLCTASGNWSLPYPRCTGEAGCCRGSRCTRGWLSIRPVLS